MEIKAGDLLLIVYRNWEGEVSERKIRVKQMIWTHNQWHPEPQTMIEALDEDKKAMRFFATSGIYSMQKLK